MLEQKWIEFLEEQKTSEYSFKKVDKLELVQLLMENIGEHNGEIRDGLVYPNLAHLLYDKHLDESDLNKITKELIKTMRSG